MVHINSPDKPPSLAQFSDRLQDLQHFEIEWQGLRHVKKAAAELKRIVKEVDGDIVTSNDMRTDFVCRMAGARKGLGIPWTAFVHGWIGFKRKWGDKLYGFYELMDRWSVRKADEIWTGSHHAAEYVKWSLPKSMPIVVMMNALEPHYLETSDETIAATRKKILDALDLKEPALLAGTLGRMAWAKGHGLLAEAVIKADRPNLGAVLIGFGEEEEALEAMSKEAPYKGRVYLPGPKASVDNMPPHLGALDIFCFPSLQESLPVAALEAMYMDNAMASSATGDLPLVLENGETGLLFPVGDVDAMADCLRKLVDDEDLRNRLRVRAGERVRRDFLAPRYSRDLENGWVDLVERVRSGRA